MRAVRVAVIAVAACLIAACGVQQDRGAARIDDDKVPFDLLEPDAREVVAGGGASASVCVLDGDRLTTVERLIPVDASPADIVRTLADLPDAEAARGLRTAISSAGDIDGVDVASGTAIVDFDEEADQAITADPLATVAQIVCTLAQQPGVSRVSFSIGGDPIEVPTADGTLTADPVEPADYAQMMPA